MKVSELITILSQFDPSLSVEGGIDGQGDEKLDVSIFLMEPDEGEEKFSPYVCVYLDS